MEIDTVASEQDVLSVDNLPTPSVLSKYRLAGHFCSVAIRTVLQQCIPGANCKDLCNVGDEAILAQTSGVYQSQERGIAEPTSINVNNCVRWYSPLTEEEGYVLQEGDIVTVSIGVHIDGYAVLSSQTIHIQSSPAPVTGPVADAACALHYATKAVVNALSAGTVKDIEEVVKEACGTFGTTVVEGSCLRRIRRFLVGQSTVEEHSGKVLEFGDTNKEFPIVPGEVYLLGLAISTGTGKVKLHPDLRPTIYTRSIPTSKSHNSFKLMAARNLFTQLTSNPSLYSVFPFTLRQHPDPSRAKLGVAELVTHGILQPCPVILEKDPKAVVVRRTITVFVKKAGEVVLLGGGETECKVMWVRSERGVKPSGELERWVGAEGVKVVELKSLQAENMILD